MTLPGSLRSSSLWYRGFAIAVAGIVAACSGTPTSTSDPASSPDPTEATVGSAATEVFDRFNGMSGEERQQALIEAAQAEGGLVVYSTAPGYEPAIAAFSDKYEIEVELFLGRSDTILQRVTQEYEAGVYQVDVFEDENARLLQAEGLTYEYVNDELTSRITGYVPEDHMIPFRLSIPVVTWNTDLVSDSDVPETVEGLADPAWDGRMVLDSGGFDWYATVHQYLAEQGRSDDEIEEYFRTIVAYSNQQPGGGAMAGLLGAGEYLIGNAILTFRVETNQQNGAPIAWKTADGGYVKPIIVAPEGATLMNRAPHPATAMLFMDFMLEEGAPLLQESNWPSPIQGAGGALDGVAEEDILVVDRAVVVDDRQRWADEWDALLRGE